MSKPQDAPKLLMPKATAVWFIDNTALDFEQIADFTGPQFTHKYARMLAGHNQARAFQFAQCLANWYARDLQPLGDIGLVDALPGYQNTAQDLAEHVFANQFGE